MNNKISKELFEQWLGEHTGLYVHVISKKTFGLPKFLTNETTNLFIGLNTAIPIPDLTVNDHEWSGTLSFEKRPYYIQCPLDSVVYVVSNNNNVLFNRKITKKMLDEIAPEVVSSGNVVAVDFRNRKRK